MKGVLPVENLNKLLTETEESIDKRSFYFSDHTCQSSFLGFILCNGNITVCLHWIHNIIGGRHLGFQLENCTLCWRQVIDGFSPLILFIEPKKLHPLYFWKLPTRMHLIVIGYCEYSCLQMNAITRWLFTDVFFYI